MPGTHVVSGGPRCVVADNGRDKARPSNAEGGGPRSVVAIKSEEK